MKVVGYIRVSTRKQARSGLGQEAQEAAIGAFCAQRGAILTETFTEVESGKSDTRRPELQRAMRLAKVTGSVLVIAKLDRLSRNAAFLMELKDSGAQFIAADMPDANQITVGIMALVAQQERESASKRTKEALTAAKARGTKLGNPHGAAALKRAGKGNAASLRSIEQNADQHAKDLGPDIESMRAEGITSLGAIADALNARGMLTRRGGQWHKSSVRNLLDRLDSLGA